MYELEVDIQTADGLMNTFITRPEDDRVYPMVLFLMDAPGKREELHDMARRIATVGYYVMLPNLYYRTTREFVIGPDNREEMFGHMNALSNAMVCNDIQSMFDYSSTDSAAGGGSGLRWLLHERAICLCCRINTLSQNKSECFHSWCTFVY